MSDQQRHIITGPGAWIGREIQRDQVWIRRLDEAAVSEIDVALSHVKRVVARIPFAKTVFPLPRLSAALDDILEQEIECGRGFMLLRGIPRDRYTDEESELIHWGLSVH